MPFLRLSLFGLALTVSAVAGAAQIRLEGVNILGVSKSAYISVDGKRIRFREGESMSGWTVVRIAPRSVDLRTPEGEMRTLTLHRSAGEESPKAVSSSGGGRAETKSAESPSAAGKAGINFSPRVIEDRDVPPGYRKVRTPFGDVLVDESKQENTLLNRR